MTTLIAVTVETDLTVVTTQAERVVTTMRAVTADTGMTSCDNCDS